MRWLVLTVFRLTQSIQVIILLLRVNSELVQTVYDTLLSVGEAESIMLNPIFTKLLRVETKSLALYGVIWHCFILVSLMISLHLFYNTSYFIPKLDNSYNLILVTSVKIFSSSDINPITWFTITGDGLHFHSMYFYI